MCCTQLSGNTGPKNRQKFAIWAPSHNFVGLYFWLIFALWKVDFEHFELDLDLKSVDLDSTRTLTQTGWTRLHYCQATELTAGRRYTYLISQPSLTSPSSCLIVHRHRRNIRIFPSHAIKAVSSGRLRFPASPVAASDRRLRWRLYPFCIHELVSTAAALWRAQHAGT